MIQVSKLLPQGQGLAPVLLKRATTVELDWDVRQKSRFSATDSAGRELGIFLPRGTLVRGGDVLVASHPRAKNVQYMGLRSASRGACQRRETTKRKGDDISAPSTTIIERPCVYGELRLCWGKTGQGAPEGGARI